MKTKRAWIAFFTALAVVLPLKIVAAFTRVDTATGFYTDGGKLAGLAFLIAAVGIGAVYFFAHGDCAKTVGSARSIPAAAAAALSGVVLAGESAAALYHGTSESTIIEVIFSVMGFFAAAELLTAAYDFASGGNTLRRYPLLALFAPLWGCVGMISLFVNYAARANRLENAYHTCTVTFLLLFLFSQARVLSGVDTKHGMQRILPFGLAALLLTITDAVTNLALHFAGRSTLGQLCDGVYLGQTWDGGYVVFALLAIYIAVYLIFCVKNGKTTEKQEEHPAVPAKAAKEETAPDSDADHELSACAAYLKTAYAAGEGFEASGNIKDS